jgi:hypothetical protein
MIHLYKALATLGLLAIIAGAIAILDMIFTR